MGQEASSCMGHGATDAEHLQCTSLRGAWCDEHGSAFGAAPSALKPGSESMDEDLPMSEETSHDGLSGMISRSITEDMELSQAPCEDYQLTLANVLDIFSICSRSLPVLSASLDALRRPAGEPLDAAAVASAAGIGTVASALPHIAANLQAVERSGAWSPELAARLEAVIAASARWAFEASTASASAPRLRDPELLGMRFSQSELSLVRRMAFAHAPVDRHDYERVRELRGLQFSSSAASCRPHAVVSIGPPAAGKTFVLENSALNLLRSRCGAPLMEDFVRLDPDYYLSNALDNNNDHREMANFLNHESFMCAVGQRRHLLFDHTGKDLVNTCGRIVARLREANYVVHLVIVVSEYASCCRRKDQRLESTGRPVCDSYAQTCFKALRTNIPWYLEHHKELAETTVLYTNDLGATLAPRVIESESDVFAAAELARSRLKC